MKILESFKGKRLTYSIGAAALASVLMLSGCGAEEPVVAQPAVSDVEEVEPEVAVETEDAEGTVEAEDAEGVVEAENNEEMDDAEVAAETETRDDSTMDNKMTAGIAGAEGTFVRASTLLDYNFINADGAVSGDLEDMVIDVNSGRILFASIEYGGFLDLGDTDIVVPMSAFTIGPEGELVLNFNEQELENFPDIGNEWPNVEDPAWDDDVIDFWNGIGISSWHGFDEPAENVVWASDLVGYALADLGGGVGVIDDLIIDLGNGTVKYILAGYGAAGTADAPFVLPVSTLSVVQNGDFYGFDEEIEPEVLMTAPRLDPALYPAGEPLDDNFHTEVDNYWGETGIDLEPWDAE